ncbi:hypothetical protein SAMD00023353_4500460 [Rosellinia necatrix]|uniref:Uncharacterized protein n=1 Tax=Rosellinia necatrix TaxID=77044 RepID=A0A1S8A9K0_ROSNE|nr:hypothetical protein SAMD00023353_4500460 [Rosellinia necatrix]
MVPAKARGHRNQNLAGFPLFAGLYRNWQLVTSFPPAPIVVQRRSPARSSSTGAHPY